MSNDKVRATYHGAPVAAQRAYLRPPRSRRWLAVRSAARAAVIVIGAIAVVVILWVLFVLAAALQPDTLGQLPTL